MGQEVILGVRPEHMVIAEKAGEHAIHTKIVVREMMGFEYHLHLLTEDGTKLIVRIPTLNLSEAKKAELVEGKELDVTFEDKAMHFFNKEDETNILYPGK